MSSKGRRPNQNNDGHRATTNNGTRSNKSIIPQTSSPGHPPSPTDHQRNINNANIASNFFFQSPQCNKDNNNHNDSSSNNAAQGAGRAPESAANNFHSVVPLQDIASLYGENATIQVSMRGSNPSFFFVRQTNNNKAGMKQNNPSVAERRRQQNSRLNSSHSDLASLQSPTAKLQAGELSSLSNRDNGINQVAERIKRENSLAVKEYLANITDDNVRDEPMARLLMAQIQNNDLQLHYGTVAATPGGVWGDHCENELAGLQMHHHQQQQQLSRRQQQLQQESQFQKRHVLMKRISDQLDEKITNGLPLTPLDHLTMTHINQYLEQQERQFLQHIQERQNAGSNISYSQLLSSRHQDHWAPRIRQMGMDDDVAPILSQLQRAQSMLERGECRVQQNDIRNESLSLEQLNKSDNKMDSKPSIKKSESLQTGLTVPDGNNHEKHAAALKVSPLKFRKEKRNAIKRSEDAVNMTQRNKKSDEPKKKKAKIRKSGCYDLSCLPVVDKSGEGECDDSLNEEINNQSENIKYPLVNTPDASIESRDDDNHKSIILNHVTKPTNASKNPNHDEALMSPRHIFAKALLSQSIQKHNTSQMNDFNKQKLINKAQATESVGDAEKSECDGERSIAQYGFCEQLVSPLHNNLNQKVSKAMDTSRYSNIHPDEFAPGPELAARFCQSEPKESYDSSESIRTQLQNCGLAVQRRMFTAAQKEGKDDLEADPNHQVHFSSSKSHACLGLLQLNCSNLLEHDSPNQATKSIDALGESEGNCPRQDSLSREFRDDSKYIALSLQESDEAIQSTMREDEVNRFGDDAYKLTHRPERDSPLSDLEREISYGNSKTTDTYCQRGPGFDSEDINTTKELPSSSASLESGLAPLELNDVIKSIEDENLRMTIEEDKKKLEFKLLERRVFYDRQITIMNSRLEVYDKLEGLAERISAIRSSNQPKRKKPGAKTPVHDMAIDMLHLAWQNYRMLESTVDRLLDLDDSDKFS